MKCVKLIISLSLTLSLNYSKKFVTSHATQIRDDDNYDDDDVMNVTSTTLESTSKVDRFVAMNGPSYYFVAPKQV